MTFLARAWKLAPIATLVAGLFALSTSAAEPAKRPLRQGQFNPEHASIEMFQGMKQGKLDVQLIVRDSTEARVMITNRTDEPLNVQLPEGFAGVHVLGQLGGGGFGGSGGGGQGGGQAVGGGMGGGGMGGMGGGGGGAGGGFFNVPSDRVAEIKAECVCLEHGKPDPRTSMTYQIKPIEEVTDKPEVQKLVKMLGKGVIDQRAAQAAVWHWQDDMSWEELAAKEIKRLNGRRYSYFSSQQMQTAVALSEFIVGELAKLPAEQTPTVEGQPLDASTAAVKSTDDEQPK